MKKCSNPNRGRKYFYRPRILTPQNRTYMYDHSSLVQTLEQYADYDKLKPGGNPNRRLMLTAVDILSAQPLKFDSYKQ